MATVSSYRDLMIWTESMKLCEGMYRATQDFPSRERYGLVSQMRRCAISIPSNIAEGFVRKHSKEFRHFLSIALGSLAELETQTEMSGRLGYLSESDVRQIVEMTEKLGRMMTNFYKRMRH